MSIPERETILLVEDEAILSMVGAANLKRYGFAVETAFNGEEAIRKVKEKPVDLILMDIDLGRGKMDGTEAAQRILETHRLPIIFLTSHAEREMVERVKGITRYGYVLKNSGEFVLMESIQMAFELFQAHQSVEKTEERFQAVFQNSGHAVVYRETSKEHAAALALVQRDREAACMQDIAHLSDEPDITLEEILERSVDLLWRCLNPASPCSKPVHISIRYENSTYTSGGFQEKQLFMEEALFVQDRQKGSIALSCSCDNSDYQETCINHCSLVSERFLPALAERLGKMVYRMTILREHSFLLESLGEAVLKTDESGRIEYVNSSAVRLCGYHSSDEMMGLPITEIYSNPESRKEYLNILHKEGEVNNIEFELKRRDTTTVSTSCNIRIIRDDQGRYNGTLAVIRDVTDRNRLIQDLRERVKEEQCLHRCGALLKESEKPLGKLVTAFAGMIPSGFTSPDQISVEIVIEGKQITTPQFNRSEVLISEPLHIGSEQIGDLHVYNHGRDRKGKPVTFLPEELQLVHTLAAQLSAIIEKHRQYSRMAEQEVQFRGLFENHRAIMFLIDPADGRIARANKAAMKWYGYSEAELTSMTIQDINQLPPEKVREEWKKAEHEERNHFYFPHRKKSGEVVNVEVYSHPVRIGEKRFLHSIIHESEKRDSSEDR